MSLIKDVLPVRKNKKNKIARSLAIYSKLVGVEAQLTSDSRSVRQNKDSIVGSLVQDTILCACITNFKLCCES